MVQKKKKLPAAAKAVAAADPAAPKRRGRPRAYQPEVALAKALGRVDGVTVLNAPGTIDADYRGEVQVLLVNLGSEPVTVTRGMRIAQLIIAQVARVFLYEVTSIDETMRGSGGFGSTGS